MAAAANRSTRSPPSPHDMYHHTDGRGHRRTMGDFAPAPPVQLLADFLAQSLRALLQLPWGGVRAGTLVRLM